MANLSRRHFLRTGLAAAGLGLMPSAIAQPKRSATDWVTLGNSGVKVTRLGMGTGTNSGQVQLALGQKELTRVIRYAYERGVRFFDTADSYGDGKMQAMVSEALKGLDRDTYTVQTKMKIGPARDPWKEIDRFRKEWNTDYFDSFLLHCARSANWTDELKKSMDALNDAKDKQLIRSKCASVHGLKPLHAMANSQWMDVALLRVNHDGTHMDNENDDWNEKGNVDHCVEHIRQIHNAGAGVIGMKLIGNGDFTDPAVRDASIKFVMDLDCVDAIVIGFKNTQEIDEAIDRMNHHLNA